MFDAYGVHLGTVYVHFYALILGFGLLVGTWITARRAPPFGFTADTVWDALTWAFLPGLIGARLYHVLTPTPASGLTTQYYLQHPLEILAIWNGGLGIYGAVIGGAFGLWLYARRQRYSLAKLLDLAVPGLLLAQAIGRWGNFVNQELYGAPSTLPWAIYISPEKRLPGYERFATYQPLFLYESLWDCLSFIIVLVVERRFRGLLHDGDLVLLYLMLYSTGRFFLDFVRLDSNSIGVLTTAQWVSLILCLSATGILAVRHRPARLQWQFKR